MKKIVIILLLLIFCLMIDARGTPTTGTFTPVNTYHPPAISVVYPSNESVDIPRNVTCYITIHDVKGDVMNISFYENTSGLWILQQSNNSVTNGTYYWNYLNSSGFATVYYWRVCTNDGINWTNATYHFTSETYILKVNFIYVIDGANIICTSTSTGPPESYKWEISNDGVIFGSTGWINDSSGIEQIFTFPDGGNICIKLYVKGRTQTDWIMKCTDFMGSNKDIYPADEYYNCKACEDAGYYWYNDSCHNTPKPLPWNVPKPLPEAEKPKDIYQINLGGWKIDLRILIVILIVIGLLWIVFSKRKKKKGDE